MDSPLDCQSLRRFGVELELNTKSDELFRRPDTSNGEIMPGSDEVGHIVRHASGDDVEIQGWDYVHNNMVWVIKYDMSCGIEINSPVLKGWRGLKRLLKVVDALGRQWPYCDERCSLHVHVSVDDLSHQQLASVIAYYIKCEHVFLDAMPDSRKNNRYCQPLGITDMFSHDDEFTPDSLFEAVSGVKYYSMNAYHYRQGMLRDENRKKAIEFRIAENMACLDPIITKNWVRLLLHFVDTTMHLPLPSPYRENDPWSGLLWLDPQDVFKVLKFDQPLSPGLQQVKEWFMDRIYRYGESRIENGVWSKEGRSAARKNFLEMYDATEFSDESEDKIYGRKWIL